MVMRIGPDPRGQIVKPASSGETTSARNALMSHARSHATVAVNRWRSHGYSDGDQSRSSSAWVSVSGCGSHFVHVELHRASIDSALWSRIGNSAVQLPHVTAAAGRAEGPS